MKPDVLPITREDATAKMATAPERPGTYLTLFWSVFPWATCENSECGEARRCWGACGNRAKKLEMLRALAEIRVRGARSEENQKAVPKRRHELRKNFNTYAGGFGTDHPCFLCGGPEWHHRHHMIQIQHGGGNRWYNIVRLCRTCHRAVHKTN